MRSGLAIAASLALAIAGCNSTISLPEVGVPVAAPEPVPGPPRVVTARFDCGDALLLIAFFSDHLVLTEPDGETTLPQAISASGARYANDDITFWNKGRDATLERDGEIVMCRQLPDPWTQVANRGIDLRAVGQEPGWFAEIDDERSMRIVYDYAERELMTPAPVKVEGDGRTTYTAVAGEQQVTAVVEERACADAMSGEPYPLTVTVRLDDRELRGCGRPVVRGR